MIIVRGDDFCYERLVESKIEVLGVLSIARRRNLSVTPPFT